MLLLSTTMIFTAGIAMTSCGDSGAGTSNIVSKATATIKFDINLDGYKTNVVKDKTVSIGKRVPIAKAYITNENPDNLQLYGWYTDVGFQKRSSARGYDFVCEVGGTVQRKLLRKR